MSLDRYLLQSLVAQHQADARQEAARVRAVRHARVRVPRPDPAPPDVSHRLWRRLGWAG